MRSSASVWPCFCLGSSRCGASKEPAMAERETAMERGFWITLSNSAGILDSAFARTKEEARELAIELLSGFPHRDDSDMPRLRVEAGAVCRPAGRASSAEVIRNFSLHSENIKEEAAAMPGLSILRSGDQLHN